MKLLNKYEMSEWAYNKCLNGNNIPEIRKLITSTTWMLKYYKNIKSDPRILDKVINSKNSESKIVNSYLNSRYLRLNNDESLIFEIPKDFESNGISLDLKNRRVVAENFQLLDQSKNVLLNKDFDPMLIDENRKVIIIWTISD